MPESKQKVRLPKSSVVGKTPNVNIMDFGELYVNYASGTGNSFLVTKKFDGTLAKFPESASVVSALNTKVDKVSGKDLSTNDFTTTLKNKLDGIASGAQVNVQSDWNATSGDALILNKPTIPTTTSQLTNDSGFITVSGVPQELFKCNMSSQLVDGHLVYSCDKTWSEIYAAHQSGKLVLLSFNTGYDLIFTPTMIYSGGGSFDSARYSYLEGVGTVYYTYNFTYNPNTNEWKFTNSGGLEFSPSYKEKLDSIESGAQVNVQSDWNATSGDAFIKNKPTIGNGALTIQTGATPSLGAFSANQTGNTTITLHKVVTTGNISDLTNNAGYITSGVSNLSNYATSANVVNALNQKADAGEYISSSGQTLLTCNNTSGATALTISDSSYKLEPGAIVMVKFSNDVPSGSTLNINGQGVKSIWYYAEAIKSGVIKSGDTVSFMYSNDHYHLMSIDRWGKDVLPLVGHVITSGSGVEAALEGVTYCNVDISVDEICDAIDSNRQIYLILDASSGVFEEEGVSAVKIVFTPRGYIEAVSGEQETTIIRLPVFKSNCSLGSVFAFPDDPTIDEISENVSFNYDYTLSPDYSRGNWKILASRDITPIEIQKLQNLSGDENYGFKQIYINHNDGSVSEWHAYSDEEPYDRVQFNCNKNIEMYVDSAMTITLSANTTNNWYENNYESTEFINGRTHYVTFTNDILDVSSAIQPMVITQEMSGCCLFGAGFIESAYNSTDAVRKLVNSDTIEIFYNSIDTLMVNDRLVFSGGHNISYLDVEIDEGCYQRLALIGNPQLYYNKLQSLFGGLNGHPIDNSEDFAFGQFLDTGFVFISNNELYGLYVGSTPRVVLKMKLWCGVKQIPDIFINTESIANEIPFMRYIGLEGNYSGTQWMDAGAGGLITIRAGDNIGVVGVGDNKLIISASSPTTYTEVTYSELLTLKQNSGLTPGAYYRMTDYKTMAKDGTVANITNPGGVNVIANDKQFDLLLLATSTTSIASEAKAVLHAGDTYFSACNMSSWQIWYDMGDDLTKVPYTYKHLLPTGHKGYIYRMIDEFNNDAFYDFKCLKFMLGQVMNKYTDIADFATSYFYTFDANGVEATVYYKGDQTYSSLTYIENNTIKLMTSDGNSNRWTTRCVFLVMRNMLGNIMIYDNKIYLSNTNACTFGASISKNTIKYSSVASEDMFINNTIENCYSLVCSGNVTNNNIKLTHQSNTTNQFGSRVHRNNICGQSKIVLENDIADNTFYNSTIDASGVSYVRYCEFNNVPNSNITFNNVGSGASNNWLQFINIRPNALNLEALPRLTSNELTRNLTETRIIEKNSSGVIKAFSLADLIQ